MIRGWRARLEALLGIRKHPKASLGYISARRTISAARREGLSVCDYVEKLWNQRGDTQKVVDQMAALGLFEADALNILEIGAGTGRYLEKILKQCRPANYEVYETARDWAKWLQATYPVVVRRADGVSLGHTATGSVDLVHAHGVFVYLPFLVAWRYFMETLRVAKPSSSVVFDCYSEDVIDEKTIDTWWANDWHPSFLPKSRVVSLYESQGFKLIKTFRHPHGGGESEYLVFTRSGLGR